MVETDTVLAEIGSGDRRFPFRFVNNRTNITINRRIIEGDTYPLFAFEPSAEAFALLEENAQAPGGITAVNCALFKGKVIYLEFHSADDRLWIDRLLADTHVLCSARIDHPHRGELAYVARRCLPDAMSAGMELRIA